MRSRSLRSVDAEPDVVELFGLRMARLRMAEVLTLADRAIEDRSRLLIGVVNAAKVVKLHRDEFLRDSLLECDVLLADGQSVVWASQLLRRRLPERVAGCDLFEELLALADRDHRKVFLLGARQDVLDRLVAEIAARWPGAEIVGARHGYFSDADSDVVADQIAASGADMLFLGMTTPKKEIFLGTHADHLGVAVLHGVGGSFDVLAGITKRAPVVWQRAGLEWAYRLLQEPRRLWRRYLVTNTLFALTLLLELVRPRGAYAPVTERRPFQGPVAVPNQRVANPGVRIPHQRATAESENIETEAPEPAVNARGNTHA